MRFAHAANLAMAWLRPNSLWPLVVMLLYCRYFLVVMDQAQSTADAYLAWLLAAASPGIWFGHCAREARVWPAALFVPDYTRTLSGMVVASVGVAFALGFLAAWIGGLASWAAAAFGTLAIAIALMAGFYCRYAALVVAFGIAGGALTLVVRDADTAFVATVVQPPFVPGVAVLLGAYLFACFLHGVRRPLADERWSFPDKLQRSGAWFRCDAIAPPPWRIVGVFGLAAIFVAVISRYEPLSLHGGREWFTLAIMLVWVICAGQSSSLPHGKLTAATNLLLLGMGRTRTDVARHILARAIVDSFLGAATFVAVALTCGAEIRLFEVFVTLAACHLYLVGASGYPWLLSNRSSVLVALPIVGLLTWLGCRLLPMSLSAAMVAFVASAAAAIYWGGRRMGRLDFVG